MLFKSYLKLYFSDISSYIFSSVLRYSYFSTIPHNTREEKRKIYKKINVFNTYKDFYIKKCQTSIIIPNNDICN